MTKYKLFTDGSHQTKLGIAGIGGQLVDENNNVVFKFSEKLIDPESFKYHESIAMLHGINKALELGVKDLECFTDYKTLPEFINKNKFNSTESQEILSHPYLSQIFALIDKFSTITFNYLPRNLNKQADKLAGTNLKNYKHENFTLKKRSAFKGQEDKLLYVPNLICEEDYHETGKTIHDFAIKRKDLIYHYLIEINKNKNLMEQEDLLIKYYLIERNPKDHRNIVSTLLNTEKINNQKLFAKVVEGMTNMFNKSELDGSIGLMFKGANFLRYPEMMLRKRAILYKNDTELLNVFIDSTNKFSSIILHNDEKLIKTHDALLENPNFEKINRIIKKVKP